VQTLKEFLEVKIGDRYNVVRLRGIVDDAGEQALAADSVERCVSCNLNPELEGIARR
jgi:hypothetical protein